MEDKPQTVPPITKRKRSAIDVFVAKDRLAMIWFSLFIVTIGFSFYDHNATIDKLSRKPWFVIMDRNSTFYLSKALDFRSAKDVHAEQTKSAVEARFELIPTGAKHPERIKRLFNKATQVELNAAIDKETANAQAQNLYVSATAGNVDILRADDQTVLTSCPVQVIRTGIFDGRRFTVVEDWKAQFVFALNQDMASNGKFPTVATKALFEKVQK